MTKRHQHISQLQSELIQKKVDWSQTRWSYRKALLPRKIKIWITATSHTQNSISYEIQKTWQYSKHNTTQYPWHHLTHHQKQHYVISYSKTPVSTTPRSNFQRISKLVVMYNFHTWCWTPESWLWISMQIAKNKGNVTELMSYWLISWHI